MTLADIRIDDKYELRAGRAFLTGTQALVRLPMMQRWRDRAAGLNTACFISGYRGSPLGGVDLELWRARKFVEKNGVFFNPGVNEDLAATSIWGTQQVGLAGDAKYDGVFAMWYGKGPGVDRSGDAFKHANNAGTAKHGGVLVLAGDDHTAKSSTAAHQSEFAFMDASIPVLNPAGVQDYLDLGLYGWAMSRYSGCWVGFKAISDTVESSASVDIGLDRIEILAPTDFEMPPGGLNIRWPDAVLAQEARLHDFKLDAVRAFARANRLDRVIFGGPTRRFGIVTTGKSYLDVRQALHDMGIDEKAAQEIGIGLYKVGMSWPLEPQGLRAFAEGLEELLVVEEKRGFIEDQIKAQLFNIPADRRPLVIGKQDETGRTILPSAGELTPGRITRVIADRIARWHKSDRIAERLAFLDSADGERAGREASVERIPYFCSGCPHNTSTRVPEGSRALAGIGCHYMAQWMDRDTATFTQMGGEGATWIGQAPFVDTPHIFQNIGDGTYYHSGLLAIRAAIAAKVNITYKLLFNDAVAMTGGQPVEGQPTVPEITRQLEGEGVRRIAVVSDEPDKYPVGAGFAAGVSRHHRSELDAVQRELRDWPGVSVLIYDQTCAAEKRRRRKRGLMPDPPRRVFINETVCEGCGDCSLKSNCLSVIPVETALGRKRAIDQSSCNKDYSCLNGFCPSFVTVEGGTPRRRERPAADTRPMAVPPQPDLPAIDEPYGIFVTGIGGTGVLTISAILGMAAHIEGKGVSTLDMAGLAQKGGAVLSQIQIAQRPEDIHAARLASGGARTIIGCDLVVTGGQETLSKVTRGTTRAVVNTHETITGDFTRDPDLAFPGDRVRQGILEALGDKGVEFVAGTEAAVGLMGDSIATNLFMLGYAYQKGLVPLASDAIERAIDLNGVAVEMSLRTFRWGRQAAHDPAAIETLLRPGPATVEDTGATQGLEETVDRRAAFLTRSRDKATAARYRALVEKCRAAETALGTGADGLADAVAQGYFKLLAYKDEYEVARLFADPAFSRRLKDQFDGKLRLTFHLAPPLLADKDPKTGHLRKKTYGPWMMGAFRVLARFKFLRGTPVDPFGWTAERRMERRLIGEYEAVVDRLLAGLSLDNHALAVDIARLPLDMRGFGHIKDANVARAKKREAELLDAFASPSVTRGAAE